MDRFRATLVAGRRRPYSTWTFLVIPPDIARRWGPGRKHVRGTIARHAFHGIVSRGEGAMRMPIPASLQARAGVRRGDTVDVALEIDTHPPDAAVPDELRAVFAKDPEVGTLYRALPPSYRRAWAGYIAEAKQPATRLRRAGKAAPGIRARTYPT